MRQKTSPFTYHPKTPDTLFKENMNRPSIILIIIAFALSFIPVYAGNPQYRLAWEDHFDGKTLNAKNWHKIARSGADWNKYMSYCDDVYELRKGRLRLFAKINDGLAPADTARYLTGGITTLRKKSITYGKIEVRARMRGGHGTWPAIWLMPVDKKNWEYPRRAEIDIMECLHTSSYVYQTVHTYYTDELKEKKNPPCQAKADIRLNRYNVYTLEILPSELIFRVNGRLTFRYPRVEGAQEGQYPFGVESYLMIDMQIGGAWPKTIDDSTLPAWMDVDYVKLYDYVTEE